MLVLLYSPIISAIGNVVDFMVGTSEFVGEEFIWKCFELFFEKVWLFQIKAVPLSYENPPSLSTMLKSAGRFFYGTIH